MPSLFIGHGSPMNAIEQNDFTDHLTELGKSLPKPKVILVISAHWLANGTHVSSAENPQTIYDFGNFHPDRRGQGQPSNAAIPIAKGSGP
jgi:4,5-DOPA dioxygenase extradiol